MTVIYPSRSSVAQPPKPQVFPPRGPMTFSQSFTATVSPTASLNKRFIDSGFTATLSPSGSLSKAIAKAAFTAQTSFTGLMAKTLVFARTNFTAVLSLVATPGLNRQFISSGFTATLSPAGTLTKFVTKVAFTAQISFTGALSISRVFIKNFVASLFFNVVNPSTITGLKAWHRADSLSLNDGDQVTTWTDSSGNGNDAVQATSANKPIYKLNIVNGKPIVRFNGNNQCLNIDGLKPTFNNVASGNLFIVCSDTNSASGNAAHIPIVCSTGNNPDNARFSICTRNASAAQFQSRGRRTDGDASPSASTATFASGFHILTAEAAWTGNANTLYLDGIASSPVTYSSGGGNTSATDSLWVALGATSTANINSFPGDIAEVLIYQPKLSNLNRSNIETYLGAKYNIPVSGGTNPLTKQIQKSLTANLSSTGALTRLTKHLLAATFSPAGALTRLTNHLLSTATLNFTGTLTRQTSRVFTASLSFVGNLATQLFHGGNLFFQSFTATLSSSGGLSRKTLKNLAASFTPTGALTRSASHSMTAIFSPTGALTRRTSKQLSGQLSFSGALTRQINKVLAATLSFVGNLATLLIHGGGNLFFQSFTATLNLTGALTRRTSHLLDPAALAFTGTLARNVRKTLPAANLSFTGAFAKTFIFTRTSFTASRSFSGALSRQTNKTLGGTLAPSGALTRRTSHLMSAGLSFVGSLNKNIRKTLPAATLSFTGALAVSRLFVRAFTATLNFAGALQKRTTKSLAGTLIFTGALTKNFRKTFAASLSFVGTLVTQWISPHNQFFVAFNATLHFSGDLKKRTNKVFYATACFCGRLLTTCKLLLDACVKVLITMDASARVTLLFDTALKVMLKFAADILCKITGKPRPPVNPCPPCDED